MDPLSGGCCIGFLAGQHGMCLYARMSTSHHGCGTKQSAAQGNRTYLCVLRTSQILCTQCKGVPAEGGFLFDRLEDTLGYSNMLPGMPPSAPVPLPATPAPGSTGTGRGSPLQQQPASAAAAAADAADGAAAAAASSIVICCLAQRSKPERNPPRIVVLCGPGAVGKGPLARRLVREHPDKFGVTVSSTTRLPREHEVDGR